MHRSQHTPCARHGLACMPPYWHAHRLEYLLKLSVTRSCTCGRPTTTISSTLQVPRPAITTSRVGFLSQHRCMHAHLKPCCQGQYANPSMHHRHAACRRRDSGCGQHQSEQRQCRQVSADSFAWHTLSSQAGEGRCWSTCRHIRLTRSQLPHLMCSCFLMLCAAGSPTVNFTPAPPADLTGPAGGSSGGSSGAPNVAGPASAASPSATQCLPSSTVSQLITFCNATTNQYAAEYQVAFNLTGENASGLPWPLHSCMPIMLQGSAAGAHCPSNVQPVCCRCNCLPDVMVQSQLWKALLAWHVICMHAEARPSCMAAVFQPENANAPNVTENAINCCERCTFTGSCNVWTWCSAAGGCGDNVPAGYCSLGYTSQATPYVQQAGGPFVSGYFLRP